VASTDHLVQLVEQLRTNTSLQEQWDQDPASAIASFELTVHERDAVLTRDSDDFVALGIVASIWELPWRLRSGSRLGDLLLRLRLLFRGLLDRLGIPRPRVPWRPPRPLPQPGPEPGPGPPPGPDPRPGPEPGPGPGPDPPGPDPGP
jgi:hypothetical protein